MSKPIDFLQVEQQTYEREKAALISAGNEGKYVLVHGDQIAGVWGTYEDALSEGYARFQLNPFMVKQIQTIERILYVNRDVTLCQP